MKFGDVVQRSSDATVYRGATAMVVTAGAGELIVLLLDVPYRDRPQRRVGETVKSGYPNEFWEKA